MAKSDTLDSAPEMPPLHKGPFVPCNCMTRDALHLGHCHHDLTPNAPNQSLCWLSEGAHLPVAPAVQPAAEPLTFATLRAVNVKRCVEGFKHALESWSVAEWTNAMIGEAGEACNVAKKMLRHRDGVAGNKGDDRDLAKLEQKLAQEIADTIIYADLVLASRGIDLGAVVRETFNAKSEEIGAKERL